MYLFWYHCCMHSMHFDLLWEVTNCEPLLNIFWRLRRFCLSVCPHTPASVNSRVRVSVTSYQQINRLADICETRYRFFLQKFLEKIRASWKSVRQQSHVRESRHNILVVIWIFIGQCVAFCKKRSLPPPTHTHTHVLRAIRSVVKIWAKLTLPYDKF